MMDRKGSPVGRGFVDAVNLDPKSQRGEVRLRPGLRLSVDTDLGPIFNIVPAAPNPFYFGGPNLNITAEATEDAIRFELLSVAVNPSTGTIVAAPDSPVAVSCYRSTDDGATWSDTTGTAARGYVAYFNGAFWNKPIGGTTLHRSTDDGATWTQVVGSVSPFPAAVSGLFAFSNYLVITAGAGGSSDVAYVAFSGDGLTWTWYTLPSTGEGSGFGGLANGMANGPAGWVASRYLTNKPFSVGIGVSPPWVNCNSSITSGLYHGLVLYDGYEYVARNVANSSEDHILQSGRATVNGIDISYEGNATPGVYKASALSPSGVPLWLSTAWYSSGSSMAPRYSENFLLRGWDLRFGDEHDIFYFPPTVRSVKGMCLHNGKAYIAASSQNQWFSSSYKTLLLVKLNNVYVP